ncbi:MAG: energy-coupling factor transporter ATPase [Oscillospiraceae bacterium]|nr:energy-coupling factor transporter ATPase [Oscillospiraceae bacterium]
MSVPILKTEGLTHVYSQGTPFETTAVENVDFQAERGEYLAVIGHTGSGKSTFIQHLNGLIRPTSGRVLFDGEDISKSKEKLRNIRFKVGMVFQYPEYQLFEETVYKDIAYGPGNMKLSKSEIDERVREAAAFTGLSEDLFEKSPFELSGGQKRRVAIAGIMAMRPEVLILDEPTAGLDPVGREDILANIRKYHDSMGSTIIMVSHSMEEVAKNAQRLVVMSGGHIVMDGSPAQVFEHGRELTEMGLDIPIAAQIAMKLRDMGLSVDKSVFTVKQLADSLVRMGRKDCD